EIERLEEILGSEEVLRRLVSDELAQVAAEHGTSRRTVLLEAAEQPATTTGGSLEVADEPCAGRLTGTGLVARVTGEGPLLREGPRGSHDVIVSHVQTSTRSTVGVVTDRGRVLRLSVVDRPSLAPTAGAPSLAGGTRIADLIDLAREEHALGLIRLDEADIARGGASALGTRQGVVKRGQLDFPRPDGFESISLKAGDAVAGAGDLEQDEDLDLGFLTAQAQLLRFPASGTRPPGPHRRRRGRDQAHRRRPGGVLRGDRRDRPGRRGHRRRQLRHPAAAADGIPQGHGSDRVPGEGPCDRRDALPPLPARGGRADRRLGGAAPGTGLLRGGPADRPAGADGPPRRLGHAGRRPDRRRRLTMAGTAAWNGTPARQGRR